MIPRTIAIVPVVLSLCLVGSGLRAQQVTGDTALALSRAAAYVERYYAQAQSIVAEETVTVQNVTRDLGFDGFARRYVYSLRVDWTPSASGPPEATFMRELVTVNGRPPRPGDEPHCTAPKPITPEPLAMFLRERQPDFIFNRGASVLLDGRPTLRLDYRIRRPEANTVEWDRECVSMTFPSRLRGRAWLDPTSGEVLRIDEGATGPVEIKPTPEQRRRGMSGLVFDRWSESTRYRPVTFTDPDETILLPATIESLSMSRSHGTRYTQTYSNYRRFVTGGRVLP
jgi:hypothetical protein